MRTFLISFDNIHFTGAIPLWFDILTPFMDTLPSSLQIRILGFKRGHYPITWGGPNVRSPFNRLYWLDRGRGLVAHERQRVELRPGRLYLFPANQTADYSCSTPIGLAWIHFNAELFGGAMDITQIVQMPLALTPSNPGFIAGLWNRFMRAAAPGDRLPRLTC